MLKIDLHTHTIASGHAFNTIYEMAEAASKKGIKVLGIVEHGPETLGSAKEVYFECLDRAPKKLYGVKLLFGAELNIINEQGGVDLSESTLKRLDFASGFHIASLYKGSKESQTAAVVEAIKNPYVSVIVHSYYRPIDTDIEKIAQAACDNNKLMEISLTHFDNSWKTLSGERLERLKKMIEIIKKNNYKVLLGSDAHVITEIGIDTSFQKSKKELGLTDKDVANNDIKYLRKFIKNI
jgi:putative hydrolase